MRKNLFYSRNNKKCRQRNASGSIILFSFYSVLYKSKRERNGSYDRL